MGSYRAYGTGVAFRNLGLALALLVYVFNQTHICTNYIGLLVPPLCLANDVPQSNLILYSQSLPITRGPFPSITINSNGEQTPL